MRFAPPTQLRIADRMNGLNAERVRSYNERAVLSLLLQTDGISRLEIGERTRLSAQTVSVIVRSLEQERLVVTGEAVRGRVGPPTVPILLNPEGAYAVGISITPEKTDIVLIDFLGRDRFRKTLAGFERLDSDAVHALKNAVDDAKATLVEAARKRLTGVGLCLPVVASSSTQAGRLLDEERRVHAELESAVGLPVFVQDDITAAAGAEMMFGGTKRTSDYLFFFVADVVYSRLVLNNHVYLGNYEVVPAFFEMRSVPSTQMDVLRTTRSDSAENEALVTRWISECSATLKAQVVSASQFVNLGTIVIAGEVPTETIRALQTEVQELLPSLKIVQGKTSAQARAIGAGSLPFISRFTVQDATE